MEAKAENKQVNIPINIDFDGIINELATENAGLRKDKAILKGQVQALAQLVQQLQGELQPKELVQGEKI